MKRTFMIVFQLFILLNATFPQSMTIHLKNGNKVDYKIGDIDRITYSNSETRSFPTLGLVAYYPFNGNAKDESGNGNNGSVDKATLASDRFGKPSSAYSFNGINSAINYGKVDIPINNFSISLWFNPKKYGDSDELLYNAHGIVGFNIILGQGYKVTFLTVEASARGNVITASLGPASLNKWNHLVAISDNGLIKLYVNGVLAASGRGLLGDYSANNLFSGYDNTVNNYFYNGYIDDICVYNRVLSDQEIQSLYKQ